MREVRFDFVWFGYVTSCTHTHTLSITIAISMAIIGVWKTKKDLLFLRNEME